MTTLEGVRLKPSAWTALHQRGPWLTRFAVAHMVILAALLVLMACDDRQISGVNIWLKPAKFALSISIYVATMAWLLGEVKQPRWLIGAITLIILASMSLEQILITLQAARGTTSHYNIATPFDSAVFSLMGFGVATNSFAALLALLLFCTRTITDRPAYTWGIRLGLAIFLLGSAQGFIMIANQGHTVGLADGGPGIPILAWSNQAGDLRIAHFIGIHAIQVLPLAGYLLDRGSLRIWTRVTLIWIISLAYLALGLGALHDALRGQSWFAAWS